jgi:hypothetical protein
MQDVRAGGPRAADDHGSTNRPDTGTHQFPAPARPSRFDRRLLARSEVWIWSTIAGRYPAAVLPVTPSSHDCAMTRPKRSRPG